MSINRILLIAAVVFFAIAAVSAFTSVIGVNELGFLALGLTAYAAAGLDFNTAGIAPRRRARVFR
ncbi:MAG: hypothetical protein ACRDYV_16360 [Acidimicrobiia bacterium]